jgi:hypothetical protein
MISLARQHYAKAPKIDPSTLDMIWSTNLHALRKIIAEVETPEQAIRTVNRFAFFDFTCTEPLLSPAVTWYGHALTRLRVNALPFGESELIGNDRCVEREDHKVSSDFLYRVLAVACLARRGVDLNGAPAILEIGGGYGSLARTICGLNRNARYVLVDLPETLFFAELFLRHSFPDKPIAYADESGWPSDAEIVLVPVGLRRLLTGQQFDLAINTNSFGEMTREDAKDWIGWLYSDIRPAKLWSLNRFLNRIDDRHAPSRERAAGMNFLWGPEWKILDWEVNPFFERCPYYMSIVTRNLHIIAEPTDEPTKPAPIDDIALMDWHARPTWSDFKLIFDGTRPMMAKGWPDLTPDLTMTGPLFRLWDAKRHGQDVDALILSYLDTLAGGGEGFEERRFLAA